ncbi:calcyphosin-2-like isoform X2 [Rhinoraja longicauda]
MDLEVKGIGTTSRHGTRQKSAQGWRIYSSAAYGPRPDDVPMLDLGRLGEFDDESDLLYTPIVTEKPCLISADSTSTVNRGTHFKASLSAHPSQRQPSLVEELIVPENLPAPSEKYRMKYQQYEEEMKTNYKQYVQQMAEKSKAIRTHQQTPPAGIQTQGPRADEMTPKDLTSLDEKVSLQQCYTSKPYSEQQHMRKLEAEDRAVEKRKQAVVEQVLADHLSRAVISDPGQDGQAADLWHQQTTLPGLGSTPLRFRNRKLHQTKVKTSSTLTENLLSNKLRFDARIISNPSRCMNIGSLGKIGQMLFHSFREAFTVIITVDEREDNMTLVISIRSGNPSLSKQELDDRNILWSTQALLKERLKSRGVRTMTGLGKLFRQRDSSGSGALVKGELLQALKEFHLELPNEDFESVWLILDQDCKGKVDFNQFIQAFVGEMNEFRKAFVRKAYMKLDPNRTGSISVNDISKFYNPKKHPNVLSGESSEQQVQSAFLDTLQQCSASSKEVTYCEFESYYEGLSHGIANDEDFANILRNCWGV